MGFVKFWGSVSGSGEVDFVLGEGGAEGGDVDAVGADGLVEEFGGDVELLGPVGYVGSNFGLDLVGVHGDLVAVLGFGVLDGGGGGDDGFGLGRGVGVGRVVRILVGHVVPLSGFSCWMRMRVGRCTG